MTTEIVDERAPHGYEDDGNTPKAPYGYKLDGTPKKSRRGAAPGPRGGSVAPTVAKKTTGITSNNKTNQRRKEMLIGLTDMLVVTPLAGLSVSPLIASRFGVAQADALAGDAVIFSHFAPGIADGLITLSESKPGALMWLDSVEEKAPYLMLAQTGIQMAKAFVGNHLNPDKKLASSGRLLAQMKVAEMVKAIEDDARAMGVTDEEMAMAGAGLQDMEEAA
jgi:hypothetical protein